MTTMVLSSINVFAAEDADFDKYTVTGNNPQGTVVSLFDYWVDQQSSVDYTPAYNGTSGINKDHALKFSTGLGNGQGKNFNAWTGSANPCSGMVDTLLENGYPKLVKNSSISSTTDESLAYLFNQYDSNTTGTDKVAGKQAHTNVDGLMQVDDDGYYYYDSTKNYAAYDSATNSFKLYNKPAVKYGNNTGQFFPFNGPSTVFDESNSAITAKSGVQADSDTMNHWFGLTMSTHFMQSEGGKTNTDKDVTYEFSGDDDVWVFIDDVLVGDLGGIHDAAKLNINFRTGDVKINNTSTGSIRSKYRAAGKEDSTEWSGNTYAGGTYHTLKFYYLERGNYASNMSLKFNLKLMPDNEIHKVDQEGNPLEGAGFDLYTANRTTDSDGNVTYTKTGESLCGGKTGKDGKLVLKADDGATINFEELYKKGIGPNYILEETTAPVGYRKVKPVWLRYDSKTGAVTTENKWSTGVSVNSRIMINAPTKLYKRNGEAVDQSSDGTLKQGSIFAIVYKRVGDGLSGDKNWASVSGSVLKGWRLHETDNLEDILKGNRYELKMNSMGAYETTISELPGDIMSYSNVIIADNKGANQETLLKELEDKADYSISYYYTTGSVDDATAANTTRLDTGILSSNPNAKEYEYQYAISMVMTDVSNDLYVQKTDTDTAATSFNDTEHCLNGVKFALYKESDTTLLSRILPGEVTLKDGATPYKVDTTKDIEYYGTTLSGMAKFKSLPNGVYYLKEIESPSGYTVNDKLIKVVANDGGTFADAGENGDNVYVGGGGVGNLLAGMEQFASNDDIDSTLTNTMANLKVSTQAPSLDGTWDPDATSLKYSKGQELHLRYKSATGNETHGHYECVKSDGTVTNLIDEVPFFTVDEGWPASNLLQCEEHVTDNKYSDKEDLGDMDISNLFVLDVFVMVRDQAVGDLAVSKTVKNTSSNTDFSDKAFDYSVKLWKESENGDKTPVTGTYKYTIKNSDGTGSGETKKIAFGQDGVSEESIQLRDGQIAVLKDIPAGTHYTVTENLEDANYWTVTSSKDGADAKADKSVSGTIPAPGEDSTKNTSTVDYTNTYAPEKTSVQVPVEKLFNGWNELGVETEFFKFRLIAIDNSDDAADVSTTMPEESVENSNGRKEVILEIHNDFENKVDADGYVINSGEFPALTFRHTGTYYYTVKEQEHQLHYTNFSSSSYNVVVKVTDDGNGKLTATSEIKQEMTDDGTSIPEKDQKTVDKATFKNTFSYSTSSVDIHLHKSYKDATGEDVLQRGQFHFRLEAVGENKATAPMPGDIDEREVTIGNAEDGAVQFQDMIFDTDDIGKTYLYRASEVLPEDATAANDYTVDGTKYDNDVYYIKINVTGNGDIPEASLRYYMDFDCTQEITMDNPETKDHFFTTTQGAHYLEFRNSYSATPVKAAIRGTKVLSGRDMKDGEFWYTLKAADDSTKAALENDTIQTEKNGMTTSAGAAQDGEKKAFAFPEMTFTKPGTYTFQVSEKVPFGTMDNKKDGVTYDSNVSTVTVKVTDENKDGNRTGELIAEVTYKNSKHDGTDAAEFVNQYAESGNASIEGTKKITGREFREGDSYTFTITPKDGAPTPVDENGDEVREVTITPNSGNSKNLDFGKVHFSKAGVTYEYTLAEKQPADSENTKGVTYDDSEYTLTLTSKSAAEKDGSLEIQKSLKKDGQEAESLTWTNKYRGTGSIHLTGTKTLTGRKWKDSDEFTFTLWANTSEKELLNAVSKDFYKIEGNKAIFKTITVSGKDVKSGNVATLDFGEIPVTNLSAAEETYRFEITESVPESASKSGIIYDSEDHHINVNVSDDGEGNITSRVSDGTESGLNFNNIYRSTVEYGNQEALVIQKTLKGHDMAAGQFEFTVEALDSGSGDTAVTAAEAASKIGWGQSQKTKVYKSTAATDGEASTIDILAGEKVTFNQDDAGKTYSYKISETKGGEAGYTNDTSQYRVDITLTDDGNGVLTAETKVVGLTGASTQKGKVVQKATAHSTDNPAKEKDTIVVPFTNSYKATGSLNGEDTASIKATKTLNGRALKAGEFKFSVTNAADTAESRNVVATGTNSEAGDGEAAKISFSEIKYTTGSLKEDVEKGLATKDGDTYTYEYEVWEETEDLPIGVTPEDGAYLVVVKVTDKGDGTLETRVIYPDDRGMLAFNNNYDTKEVTIPIKGSKVLSKEDGATVSIEDIAGKFHFALSGKEITEGHTGDAPMPTLDGKKMTTADNGKTGEVDFGHLSFKVSDFDGIEPDEHGLRTRTFEYKVTESGSAAGVENDSDATKTFTVKVQYNDKEKAFQVEGLLDDQNQSIQVFQFVNAYRMEPKTVETETIIPVRKILEGRDLAKDEFNFEILEVVDGKEVVVAEGTNRVAKADEKAIVDFDPIKYNGPGEHDYIVREVIPEGAVDAKTNYDAMIHSIHVSVTDNGDGTLKVASNVSSEQPIEFVNKDHSSDTPSQPVGPTGPDNPSNPNNPSGNNGGNGTSGGNTSGTISTGDDQNLGTFALLGVLALGGLAVIVKKRRDA